MRQGTLDEFGSDADKAGDDSEVPNRSLNVEAGEELYLRGEVIGRIDAVLDHESYAMKHNGEEFRKTHPRRVRVDPVEDLDVDAVEFHHPGGGPRNGPRHEVTVARGEFRMMVLTRCVDCDALHVDERVPDPFSMPAPRCEACDADHDHDDDKRRLVTDGGRDLDEGHDAAKLALSDGEGDGEDTPVSSQGEAIETVVIEELAREYYNRHASVKEFVTEPWGGIQDREWADEMDLIAKTGMGDIVAAVAVEDDGIEVLGAEYSPNIATPGEFVTVEEMRRAVSESQHNDTSDAASPQETPEVDTETLADVGGESVENSNGETVGYQRDMMDAIGNGGGYACGECEATFGSAHGLKSHYGQKHGGPASPDDDDADAVRDAGLPEVTVDPDTGVESTEVGAAVAANERADAERDEKTAEELWDEAEWSYHAAQAGGAVSKVDARNAVVKAFESERDFGSVRERCDRNYTHLMAWDDTKGQWRQDAWQYVAETMATKLGAHATTTEIKHVIGLLGRRNPIDEQVLNAGDDPRTLVPVKNGTLDLSNVEYDPETKTIDPDTVELLDADPDRYFLFRIDTEWDPDAADIDGLDAWMREITMDAEDRRILWEFAGHALTPDYPADGFLVKVGEGGGGKSMWQLAVKKMIGGDNYTTRSISEIKQRFGSFDVVDACANVTSELEGTALSGLGKLKAMTAGEKTFVESKGNDGFDVENSATMIFASDSPPAFDQENRALGRRLYPVEFRYRYTDDPDPANPFELEKRPKPVVEAELTQEERLKAALLRAVEGLVRLAEEGDFSSEQHWEDRVKEYQSWSDPAADYESVCLEDVGGNDAWIHTHDLLGTYNKLADAKGHPGKTHQTLITQLEQNTSITLRKDRSSKYTAGSDNDVVYKGLAFTREALDYFVPDSEHRAHYEKHVIEPNDNTGDEHEQDGLDVRDVRTSDGMSDAEAAYATLKGVATMSGRTDRVDIETAHVALDAAGYETLRVIKKLKKEGEVYEAESDTEYRLVEVDDDNGSDGGDDNGESGGKNDSTNGIDPDGKEGVGESEGTVTVADLARVVNEYDGPGGAPRSDVVEKLRADYEIGEDAANAAIDQLIIDGRIVDVTAGRIRYVGTPNGGDA